MDRISAQTFDQLKDIVHMINSIPDNDITLTTLKRAQRQDKDLQDLIMYLQTDELPEDEALAKTILKRQTDYLLIQDVLVHVSLTAWRKFGQVALQLVIPEEWKQRSSNTTMTHR